MAKKTTVIEITGSHGPEVILLTPKEVTALRDLFASSKGSGHDFGFTDEMPSIAKAGRGGIAASLSKKNLLVIHPASDDGVTQFVFTDEGKAVCRKLGIGFNDEPAVVVLDTPPADAIDGAAILAACGMAAPSTAAEEVIEIPQDTEEPTAPEPKKPNRKPAASPGVPVRTGKKARREAKRAEEAKATPAKPTPKPTATPAKATDGDKKDGLRKPQLKIIQALKSAGRGLTRKEIVAATKLDNAWMSTWIGAVDPVKRAGSDTKYFPGLLTLGLVKIETHDVDGKNQVQFSLTAAGRKAADKIS